MRIDKQSIAAVRSSGHDFHYDQQQRREAFAFQVAIIVLVAAVSGVVFGLIYAVSLIM
jgi:hypothetical protein